MPDDMHCLESVPSGLRWFCYGCSAQVSGLSEVDEDEARRLMPHKPGCEFGPARGEGESHA